jgi:hypothetical protein
MNEAYKQPDSAVEIATSTKTVRVDVRYSGDRRAECTPPVNDPRAEAADEYGENPDPSIDFFEVSITRETATQGESIAIQAVLIGFALVYIPLLAIATVAMLVTRLGVPLAARGRSLWKGGRSGNGPK